MIRNYFIAITLLLATSMATNAQQVMYSQNFEDTARLFQDYVLINLDKADPVGTEWDTLHSVAWFVSVAGATGNHAAISTSAYQADTAADDWFITPAIRLGEKSELTFKSMSLVTGKSDTYEIYVSTTEQSVAGCLFNSPVGQFTSTQSGTFESHSIDLAASGFANKSVFIGFRLTTASGGDKLAIDDIEVTETVTQFKNLTFIVNMSKYIADSLFSPLTDTVDVAGTFNNYIGTKHILSIVPGTDSTIYSITIAGFLDGDQLEFKFRINSTWNDSIVEFPYGQPNRTWTIEEGKYTYTCFYNDQGTTFSIPENSTTMSQVSVYPNPVRNMVYIGMPEDITQIRMVSLTGQKIMEQNTSAGNTISIDAGTMAKGTYILLFYTNQGFAGSKKLVRN